MSDLLKILIKVLGLIILWVLLLYLGVLNGWWHKELTNSKDPSDFFNEAIKEIEKQQLGSIVMAIIENGEVYDEYIYSKDGSVDRNTAFQVASLSKWVTACGVMVLVDQGRLDLDIPVDQYLTRWQLPESEFDHDQVTIRRLLSHTAGLTDGLGYEGFALGEALQSLEASLTQASDASRNATGKVQVGVEPGSKWIYSGGGYTLLQLIIEEVTQTSFQDYMEQAVFATLNMCNSSFNWQDYDEHSLAKFYDVNGIEVPHLKYTSLAATSLYTSLNDMERFVISHFIDNHDEVIGSSIMGRKRLDQMKEAHAYQMGAAIWGLGTMLYADNNQNDYIIGHDGKNEPAINTTVRIDPSTRDGIIILEMGDPILATTLGSEWVFWKTGNVDSLLFLMMIKPALKWFFIGALMIIILVVCINYIRKRVI